MKSLFEILSLTQFLAIFVSASSSPTTIKLELRVILDDKNFMFLPSEAYTIQTLLTVLRKYRPYQVEFPEYIDQFAGAKALGRFLDSQLPLEDGFYLKHQRKDKNGRPAPGHYEPVYANVRKLKEILKVDYNKKMNIGLTFSNMNEDVRSDDFEIRRHYTISMLLQRLALDSPISFEAIEYTSKKQGAQAVADFLDSELPKTKYFQKDEKDFYTMVPVKDGTVHTNLKKLIWLLKNEGVDFTMDIRYAPQEKSKKMYEI
jgi:hypothetical protein